MSQPLDINAPELSQTAERLLGIGQNLREDGVGFTNAFDGIGNFAGSDKFGDLVNSVLGPTIDGIRNTADNMARYMNGSSANLSAMAHNYTAIDQFNAESIRPVSNVTHLA